MAECIRVLVGSTRKESQCVSHFRLYATSNARRETMIFDGMDGVVIDKFRATAVKGCWADVEGRPLAIRWLVGSKGLSFLRILLPRRMKIVSVTTPVGRWNKAEILFTELRVISAWQFSVVSSPGVEDKAQKAVLFALRRHLGMNLRRIEWVLE